MFERAKEQTSDRVKNQEDSHEIKHWLTSHEDLLAPPTFKFRIMQTFQDPLTCQLAEAVRIDLRGEGILNSKAEYSRCRVPRLKEDMEGWKKKEDMKTEVEKAATLSTSNMIRESQPVEVVLDDEIFNEIDLKRMPDEKAGQEGRKHKKRKLDPVIGWGSRRESSPQEDLPEEPVPPAILAD